MAIYCMQCGKELPDDAKFCLKCGKPLKDAVTVASQDQAVARWEYCEIVCKEVGFFIEKNYFLAQAVGSKGRYEAARSTKKFRTVSGAPDTNSIGSKPLAEAALDEIMSKLSADGWELTGQKGKWWEYKYRRLERS